MSLHSIAEYLGLRFDLRSALAERWFRGVFGRFEFTRHGQPIHKTAVERRIVERNRVRKLRRAAKRARKAGHHAAA